MDNKITDKKVKNTYYQCVHCKDEIFWNTHKVMIFCKCNKVAIDGCEDYVRICGNEKDFKIIQKDALNTAAKVMQKNKALLASLAKK